MNDLDLGLTLKGFTPGQKLFGRYTLQKMLGRGGMGVVWLAHDEELGRGTALKFLPEVVANDRSAIEDLKREVRRAINLSHPHIVKIHDFVTDGLTAAVSMEYVTGDTLSSVRIDQSGQVFTPAQLAPWITQLCAALDYAHTEAEVVHRDLKPANLMVDARGRLKVLDFGIAASLSESVTRVSKQAGSSGTPVYMSPQQMMGEKPAVTDDIYAFGATLYELLTGKPPFYTGNIIRQVEVKVPPRLAVRREELGVKHGAPITPEWEAAIAACLAKDPAGRPQSAGELADRLGLAAKVGTFAPYGPAAERLAASAEALHEGRTPKTLSPVKANASGATRSTKTPLIAGLAAVFLLLAGAAWYFASRAPEQLQTGQAWTIPDLNLTLQPIAAGTFMMGNTNGESDEKPVTQVRITRAYWLGQTEVTQREWQAVMGNNPSGFKGDDRPVEQVSWTEAMEFCRKLTERERAAGRLPEGYAYTLPTEAQWEYACRSGTTGDHAGSLDAMGWYSANSGGTTQSVGEKRANSWGLADMHGNVWEWCADWYGNYRGGSVVDPTGAASGSVRVYRGGSWGNGAGYCRSAFRNGVEPGGRGGNLGFRLALSSVR